MTLSLLVPITIDDTNLTSSTQAEADYSAWSAVTTYAVGDKVISTTTHRIYRSEAASNLNNDPTDIENRLGATPWWSDFAPTNKWAMFDDEVSTQTDSASPLTVVLEPGFFDGMAFFGLEADQIDVTVKDAPGGNTIFTYSSTLEDSAPVDYWEYFFDGFRPKTALVLSGIEPYYLAEATVTLSNVGSPAGNVKCGVLAVGDLKPLGDTLVGSKVKPKTYSRIEIDDYGNNVIVRRKNARDLSITALISRDETNLVSDALQNTLDIPCVVVGSEDVQLANLLGFGLISGELSHDGPNHALLSLNLNGLI